MIAAAGVLYFLAGVNVVFWATGRKFGEFNLGVAVFVYGVGNICALVGTK